MVKIIMILLLKMTKCLYVGKLTLYKLVGLKMKILNLLILKRTQQMMETVPLFQLTLWPLTQKN